MLEQGGLYEMTADDLSVEGAGIGRIEGVVVFVPGLLMGERARVKITALLKRSAKAELIGLLSRSEDRVLPPCPFFPRCGGCTMQHLSYAGQLAYKQKHVENCLRKIGGIDAAVRPVLSAGEPLGYRNKTLFPVREEDGPKAGYFVAGSGTLLPIDTCLLQSNEANAALKIVQEWMQKYSIVPYDPAAHRGLVRRLLFRQTSQGDLMVGLVINGENVPHADALVTALCAAELHIKSIVACINKKRGADILQGPIRVLFGSDALREDINGLAFEVSAKTFLQVNHKGAELLYKATLDLAGLSKTDRVVDLYCGAGTISLQAARRAAYVYGVEIVKAAVEDARRNAACNAISNVEFIYADAKQGMAAVMKKEPKIDVAILDPPRRGADAAVVAALLASAPEKIVYISCDPATLARDLKKLTAGGYAVRAVQPVDLFPQTTHVETVVLMSRVKE